MSDSDLVAELEDAAADYNHNKSGCKVCWHMEQMSDAARTAIEACLAGNMGGRTLAEIMTRNGYPVGATSIIKHRKGHMP